MHPQIGGLLFFDQMPNSFSKPAKTFEEQVELLVGRGMIIRDHEKAKFYFQHLNYYRLRAYWLFFEADPVNHRFREGTEFDDVLNLYIFDRELRLLILDAVERIEVSVRSQWAYHLAHLGGSHAHLNQSLFDQQFWQKDLNDLTKEVERSKEVFIQHFQKTYSDKLPPVWAVCEVMSFGLLSRWFSSIRSSQTQSVIAKTYNVRANFLKSWLRHLSLIRNSCAHHSRLWNRDFTVIPILITNPKNDLSKEFIGGSRKIYNTLVILLYLMDQIAPKHHWRARLRCLLVSHARLLSAMDFPTDWLERNIWQE